VRSSRKPALLACLVVLAGCGGGDDGDGGPRVVLTGSHGEQTVAVEVADSPAERERGLMNRTSLPRDQGMVFVWGSDHTGAFWMKDTRIPLSIAFYGADGRVLKIFDMVPCRRDPCPLYDPEVAYRGALEVNRGAFGRWRIAEGDRLRLER
jgi:uncharacterized membrane protein (UPF0127 family)